MRVAPLSRISRAVIVLPSASLGSDTLKRSTMNRVVWRAVSASASARTRWRSASLRASQAAPASVEVIAMPVTDAAASHIMRPMPTVRLALLQFVEPDAEHAGDELQLAVELACPCRAARPQRSARCARCVSSPSDAHPVDQRWRESTPGRHRRVRRRARLAVDDQRKDAVLAPEPLEGLDLFVDPARLRRLARADHDLERRLLAARASGSRRGWSRSRVRRGRETPARVRSGTGPNSRLAADEVLRHPIGLERLVQPLRPLLVGVAVADERAVL